MFGKLFMPAGNPGEIKKKKKEKNRKMLLTLMVAAIASTCKK